MNLVIFSSHPLLAMAMGQIIKDEDGQSDVVIARTWSELFKDLKEKQLPDLIILDHDTLAGGHIMSALTEISEQFPLAKLAVLSQRQDSQIIRSIIAKGARGVILKSMAPQAMIHAIKLMTWGDHFIPGCALFSGSRTDHLAACSSAQKEPETVSESSFGLTGREYQVLCCLADGLSNKEIARRLQIAEVTVKVHLGRVYRKIGVQNRANAMRFAWEHGVS
ncbi:MAG: response regulator [Alphaproteobacteria bacterium]|nr:response regulator [Alphaproteobacteria bacterium]